MFIKIINRFKVFTMTEIINTGCCEVKVIVVESYKVLRVKKNIDT
jgi:hypothetical protein